MVVDELTELAESIEGLAGTDPMELGNFDAIRGLFALRDRLDAVVAQASAAFDASGQWSHTGARSAASWISILCNQSLPAAKTAVRLGRALRDMDRVAEAWSAGEISEDHVKVLASVRTPVTAEAFDRDEKALVDDAVHMRFSRFKDQLAYWLAHADPDGAERSAKDKADGRRFHLSRSYEDMWFGDLVLDPVRGAILRGALDRIEAEFFEADWAEARERLGDAATVGDLRRTGSQRLADALVELAIRASTAPANGRRPEPLFSVFVGYETLAGPICELANGTVLSPGTLLAWLDQAWIERIVFDAPSRVIDVGEARRIFSGATKRAIQVRDRECYHPLCELPAEYCQVDHIVPWSQGGPTTEANGRLACGFHNRRRNDEPDGPDP